MAVLLEAIAIFIYSFYQKGRSEEGGGVIKAIFN